MIDVAVIAIYLIGITAFGIWAGFRRRASADQYFLANRSLGWFTVGAAVFTSNISTIHLVGLAAGGAKNGLVIGNFEWMACFLLVVLALLFVPFYLSSKVRTLPEFMERRYCSSARTFLVVIALLSALLIDIGISLYAGAVLFQSFLGVPMFVTILVLSIFTVTYTALGGLKAVVMTENIQVWLLLGGATLVTVLACRALHSAGVIGVGGFQAAVAPGQLSMLRPIADSQGHLGEFSWLGVLLGYPVLGIWYWCFDQTHVQRVLGAKDQRAGQIGAIFAGFLKILPVFLMVLPGVIGYVLWQKGVIRLDNLPRSNVPDYNTMLPALINYLVPVGLKGLMAACMASALMSCIAAALNACATLISLDIVKRIWPETPEMRVVSVGRVCTGIIMLLAILWSTQGGQFGTIFEAINKIPMIFAPPVTVVFVLGVLWKRGTKQGAMATLYAGTIIGAIYFILDMPDVGRLLLGADSAREGFNGLITDPVQGLGIPFMLVGALLAILCAMIYMVVSLLNPAMDEQQVARVCWNHPLAFLSGKFTGAGDPRILALLLLATVSVLYYLFR